MSRIRKFDFQVQVEEPEGSGNFSLLTLSGTLIPIPGWEGFWFVYHKFPDDKRSRISELLTGGMVIDNLRTKSDGIEKTLQVLKDNVDNDHEKLRRKMRYLRDSKIKVNGWEGRYLNEKPQGRLL